MVSGKVSHGLTQKGIHPKWGEREKLLTWSRLDTYLHMREHTHTQPVIFLLNSRGKLLVVLLNVNEADGQRVPLGPNELHGVRQVHQLTCSALKPEHGGYW